MKNMKTMTRIRRDRGFTLVELLVAGAVFVLIVGAALSLFATHAPLFNKQQNLAALNIQIRNAVSQLQLDAINAGSGYYQGTNVPELPLGLTIQNNTATPCNTPATFTYGPNCFDQINIISSDQSTPASHPSNGAGGCALTTGSPMYATPVAPTTAAQLAADFHTGDQLLLINAASSQVNTVILTQNGSVSGANVQLNFGPTAANGTNAADPAFIAVKVNNKLGTSFCTTDWISKILPISYKVDTSTPSNPKLIREQPSGIAANDVVVAEQIIGFKIGAMNWNSMTLGGTADDELTYNYDSGSYTTCCTTPGVPTPQPYNFSLVRSIQMELIARTNPNPDPSYVYRNGFDQGPYQIQSVSVVVNPRNLTMNNH
jgi:prepilin-type N-terminal cleavage/methylation domain-containing protein